MSAASAPEAVRIALVAARPLNHRIERGLARLVIAAAPLFDAVMGVLGPAGLEVAALAGFAARR